MAQFDVHRNPNAASSKGIPYLINVQSELLESMKTRVVVPLARPEIIGNMPVKDLNPWFEIDGEKLVMLTPELAGVSVKHLGQVVSNLIDRREDIVRALDILISGV